MVMAAWRAFEDQPGVARVVSAVELLDDLVDLTPQRQVPAAGSARSPDELTVEIGNSLDSLRTNASELSRLAGGGSWPTAQAHPRTWRTATVGDLIKGAALTLARGYIAQAEPARIQDGDVILPELLRSATGSVRVASPEEHGAELGQNLLLLRPDTNRLDPYFLAGFLASPENMRRAVSGTTTIRLDVKRLQLPLLPLAEQRRYGAAFRRVQGLADAAKAAIEEAERAAQQLFAGLTSGALQPTEPDVQLREKPKGSL